MSLFIDAIKTDVAAQERNRAWIEVLRSGKYEQANGYLRRYDAYCCLGVACDLVDSARWRQHPGIPFYGWGDSDQTGLPPDYVADLYCWRNRYGTYGSAAADTRSLAFDNDNGATFREIADTIERELNAALAEVPA